jgi:uncharacterized protein (TIGR02391 family)
LRAGYPIFGGNVNLETLLQKRLWDEIRKSYEDKNYTGAIIDAVYLMSNILRDKTGLKSDGVALVGQALGGKNPMLKVTKLESESDLNIQQGLEQILRGIYQAIRNPRSHEKHIDNETEALAIILFIDYLIKEIDKSKSPFTIANFIKSVFDQDFVSKDRYAKLLIAKIPPKKKVDVALVLLHEKSQANARKLGFFYRHLLKDMTDDEKTQVYVALSEDLETADELEAIKIIIQMIPDGSWQCIEEIARLRIENKIVKDIYAGKYKRKYDKCPNGWFATWARRIMRDFTLKKDLIAAFESKLFSSDSLDQDYVFEFFFETLIDLSPKPDGHLIQIIKTGLSSGDKRFYDAIDAMAFLPEEWQKTFEKEFEAFVEKPPDFNADDDEDLPF